MSGNTLGRLFCVTSFGESHGPAIGCVVDGCPPGMALAGRRHPARPRPAQARHLAPRDPAPRVRRRGDPVRRVRRPHHRHADRAADPQRGPAQQGLRRTSPTPSGRATPTTPTGRSTASATIAAADARRRARRRSASRPARSPASGCASATGWSFAATSSQLGPNVVPFDVVGRHVDDNPFFVANAAIVPELEAFMDRLRKSGDSCGAQITVVASGVPVGWGEPVYDRLDADLAHAMMGINAVKGVEIGAGFARRRADGHRALRRDDAGGLPVQPRRRHPRRHLDRAGHRRHARGQADLVDAARPPRRSTRPATTGDREHARPPRSLRRHPRDADRRGDAGDRADGPRAAPPRAERRRGDRHAADRRAGRPAGSAPARGGTVDDPEPDEA